MEKLPSSTSVALSFRGANNHCPTYLKWCLWETNNIQVYYDTEIGIVSISISTLIIILAVITIKLQSILFPSSSQHHLHDASPWQPDAITTSNALPLGYRYTIYFFLKSKIIARIFPRRAVASTFMCILRPCKEMNKIQQENCGGCAGMAGWCAF